MIIVICNLLITVKLMKLHFSRAPPPPVAVRVGGDNRLARTLQTTIFAAPAAPGSLQTTIFVDPTPSEPRISEQL